MEIKEAQLELIPDGWAIYMKKGESSNDTLWAFETPDQLGCSPDHWGWNILNEKGYWEFKFFVGEE